MTINGPLLHFTNLIFILTFTKDLTFYVNMYDIRMIYNKNDWKNDGIKSWSERNDLHKNVML